MGIRAARPDPIFSNPNRAGPDSLQPDRSVKIQPDPIPIEPEILSSDLELEFITENTEINFRCDDHQIPYYKFPKIL